MHHLPSEAATVRAQAPQFEWGTTDYLLALIADLLAAANWQRAGSRRAPRPKPIPRPGATARGRRIGRHHRPRSVEDIDRIMQHWSEPRPGRENGTRIVK